MIVTDEKFLRQRSSKATYEEGLEILQKLRNQLTETPGMGLAAPQIGILKSVALIVVKDKPELSIINPIIIKSYDPIIFYNESCLSFPGRKVNTQRFQYAVVKDDLHPHGFVCCDDESVCVQHEIDHLNGVLLFDHEHKQTKVGRNDPCPFCLKMGKTIKFKKCKEHYGK